MAKITIKDRKAFEKLYPPPEGMEWDDKLKHYKRSCSTILLGDCMKWDRMLEVWIVSKKIAIEYMNSKGKK